MTDAIVGTLGDLGVRRIFGIPRDAINDLVESIRKQDRVRFIQVRRPSSGENVRGSSGNEGSAA